MTQQTSGMPEIDYSKENFTKLYEALKSLLEQELNQINPKVKLLSIQEKVNLISVALASVEGRV